MTALKYLLDGLPESHRRFDAGSVLIRLDTRVAVYVDNTRMYEEMKIWVSQIEQAKLDGKTRPPMTEFLGSAVMLIANRLSKRGNFKHYSYREDMVSDAVLSCCRSLHKFNPTKSKSVFSYCTRICWNAFVSRLTLEKTEAMRKLKLMHELESAKPAGKRNSDCQLINADKLWEWEQKQKQKNRRYYEASQARKVAKGIATAKRYRKGRPRDMSKERCPCKKTTLHSARLSKFYCCKKAGVLPFCRRQVDVTKPRCQCGKRTMKSCRKTGFACCKAAGFVIPRKNARDLTRDRFPCGRIKDKKKLGALSAAK